MGGGAGWCRCRGWGSRLAPGAHGSGQRPSQAGAAGFTLIELLVAITLLGLLLAAIFGGLRLGTRAWETGAARLERSSRLQVVQDFLRQRLSGILPLDAEGNDPPTFEGQPDAVRFVAALPAHLGGGLHEFVLTTAEREAAGDGEPALDLVVRWRRLVPADEPFEALWQERTLLTAIEGLSLDYWGSQQAEEPGSWHAEWAGAPRPPELVRVAVVFAEADPRRFPALIVRAMIDRSEPPDF